MNDSVEGERLKIKWRGGKNGVEILGPGGGGWIQSTGGSVSLEQVEGHIFDWEGGRSSVDTGTFGGLAGS